jgi:hypothetical protein
MAATGRLAASGATTGRGIGDVGAGRGGNAGGGSCAIEEADGTLTGAGVAAGAGSGVATRASPAADRSSSRLTGKTAGHTAHRARTPSGATLAGSTR